MDNLKTKNHLYLLSSAILIGGTFMLGITIIHEDSFTKQYYACVPDALEKFHDTNSSDIMMDYLETCQDMRGSYVEIWYTLFLLSFLLVTCGTTLGVFVNRKEE